MFPRDFVSTLYSRVRLTYRHVLHYYGSDFQPGGIVLRLRVLYTKYAISGFLFQFQFGPVPVTCFIRIAFKT